MRYVELAARALGLVIVFTVPAAAATYDFENLAAGHRLAAGDFGPDIDISVSPSPGVLGAGSATVFDPSCPQGCTGEDQDLITPGDGPGNNVAQGRVLAVGTDADDAGNGGHGSDGHDSDHDSDGSSYRITRRSAQSIELRFLRPYKVYSLRIIDIEPGEAGSRIEIDLVSGKSQTFAFEPLGNNSAQTLTVGDPQPALALRIIIEGGGAIDDITLGPACGDGKVDVGTETCDPPGQGSCGYDCMWISPCADDSGGPINGGASCSDGDGLCTLKDTCVKGVCVGQPLCTPGCQRCDAGLCLPLCGNPHQSELDAITVADALFNLNASVGNKKCAPCICDVNNDGKITATDTLITLRAVVLLPAVFDCSSIATVP